MSLTPGQVLGSYQVLDQVGRGGMATVFKGVQPALQRYVAIKVLPAFFAEDQTLLARFRQESAVVANLRHPNILAVYDFNEQNGVVYLVSEFVDGGTLADAVGQPLSAEEALNLLRPVASALDYAHARGIVHRDVKPSNVLLHRDGTPVLSDFGLVHIAGGNERLTATGMTVGTPEYMAPEQATGSQIGPSCDIYALAVILYEMLTGNVPFTGETPLQVVLAHLHNSLPPPRQRNPAISPAVEQVVLKGLAKKPEDRYQSAGALIQALEQAIHPGGAFQAGGPAIQPAPAAPMTGAAPSSPYAAPGPRLPQGSGPAIGRPAAAGAPSASATGAPPSPAGGVARPGAPGQGSGPGLPAGAAAAGGRGLGFSAKLAERTAGAGASSAALPRAASHTPNPGRSAAGARASLSAAAAAPEATPAPRGISSRLIGGLVVLLVLAVGGYFVVPRFMADSPEKAWAKTSAQLDPMWGKDWPRAISALKDYVGRFPNQPQAVDKLYAAYIGYAQQLAGSGLVAQAEDQLRQAQDLAPNRPEAPAALAALSATPKTPPPAAGAVQPGTLPQDKPIIPASAQKTPGR